MECSQTNVGRLSLDQFVEVVSTVYSMHDKQRSLWDVWCHALHHAAGVAKQIRMGKVDQQLFNEMADFSLWFFTLILKLRGKFGEIEGSFVEPRDRFIRIQSSCSDLLWHKYPKLCPSCVLSAGKLTAATAQGPIRCECVAHQNPTEPKDARRERLLAVRDYAIRINRDKPTTIDGWQEMFADVFDEILASTSPIDITLHLMEELGEVADAMIRMYTYKEETFRLGEPNWRQMNLESQLADVFSCCFALAEKLDRFQAKGVPGRTQRLSGIIWRRYGSDDLRSFFCPFCKSIVCCCPIILVPPIRTTGELLANYHRPDEERVP